MITTHEVLRRLEDERKISYEVFEQLGGMVIDKENKDKSVQSHLGRLAFPVKDHLGVSVGWVSRKVVDDDSSKWKLSPNFPKKEVLYHLHEAKHFIAYHQQAILCEGVFDVAAMKELGLHHTVGCLGSSVDDAQLKQIKEAGAKVLIIATDHDVAGYKNALDLVRQARQHQLTPYLINLGNHKDPSDWLKELGKQKAIDWLSEHNPFAKSKLSHILTPEEFHSTKQYDPAYREALNRHLSRAEQSYKTRPQTSKQDYSQIKQLKQKVNIVAVAEELLGMTLKPVGRGEYVGICPTLHHQEKTPSFFINETKQCYKCFGCGSQGDVIQLLKESLSNEQGERLTFGQVLGELNRYIKQLPESIQKQNQERHLRRRQQLIQAQEEGQSY